MKKRLVFLPFILAAILALTACGQAANDAPDANVPPGDTPEVEAPGIEEPSKPDFFGQKLTISQCFDFNFLAQSADNFKQLYPGVEIEIHDYANDIAKYTKQVGTQLMAGEADDILDAEGLLDTALFESGLLADFYQLMKNDPAFNEADFYTNVFDGMAYKDKLVVFPVNFSYRCIAVNNTFSPQLTEKFRQYDKISYRQLLELYNSLENKEGYYVSKTFDAITAINYTLNSFVDFENKKCYFNTPEFIQFLIDAKNGTNPQKLADGLLGEVYNYSYFSKSEFEQQALQYLFVNAIHSNFEFFLPGSEEEIFTHLIPLTDEDGNILMTTLKRFCVNQASSNKELAWEFIKFLTTAAGNENIPSFARIPVNKELFQTGAPGDIGRMIMAMPGFESVAEEQLAQITEHVMAVLGAYNEMPMEYQRSVRPETAPGILAAIPEIITAFYNGAMTAEQAASELQNKVSLYLME